MKLQPLSIVFLFLCLFVTVESSFAHSGHGLNELTEAWIKKCPVTGVKQLRKFVRGTQFACYSKASTVKLLGYTPFKIIKNKRRASVSGCKFLAIAALGRYFNESKLQCFPNVKAAKNAGFTRFVPPTPTPTATPTPDPEPLFATPTPTPTGGPVGGGDPIHFTFILGPYQEGSGYFGNCTATLNGPRTQIDIACSHNVDGASEAHLHVVPHNERFCPLPNPSRDFTMSCPLTQEQGEGIAAGNGLLSIHLAPGAQNQAAAGMIRNP